VYRTSVRCAVGVGTHCKQKTQKLKLKTNLFAGIFEGFKLHFLVSGKVQTT
jgi:hypothetical protein